MNCKELLTKKAEELGFNALTMSFPDISPNPEKIRIFMVSEAPPENPEDSFYSPAPHSAHWTSLQSLFRNAGAELSSMSDLIAKGIYLTTAIKTKKSGYEVSGSLIEAQLPLLELELSLFPKLNEVWLMGDVARKAFNRIAKKRTGKNALPSGSTYKLREQEFFYEGLRVVPSYVLAGGNLLIEKSKRAMIEEELTKLLGRIG